MAQKKKVPAKSPAKNSLAGKAKAPAALRTHSPSKPVQMKSTSNSKPAKTATSKPKSAATPQKSQQKSQQKSPQKSQIASAKSPVATKAAAVKAAAKPVRTAQEGLAAARATAARAINSQVKAPVGKVHAQKAEAPLVQSKVVKPASTVAPAMPGMKPVAVPPARPAMPQPAAYVTSAIKKQPFPMHQPARTVSSATAKQAMKTFQAPPSVPATAGPATPRDIAAAVKGKPVSSRHGFKTNEFIVYPAHGVGRIVGIEEQEIAGMSLELFVIQFEKDKMTLRVPTGKLQSVGMRKLADEDIVRRAMETLKGRARVKRTMWSRRAQEYEAKINSGDLVAIAEVVRDLYRSESQPEQSYSERQLYEAALDRMAREIAAVERLDERGAVQRITEVLAKSAKGRRLAAEAAEAGDSADVKAA